MLLGFIADIGVWYTCVRMRQRAGARGASRLTLERRLVASIDTDFVLVFVIALAERLRFRLALELVDGLARVFLGLLRNVRVVDSRL